MATTGSRGHPKSPSPPTNRRYDAHDQYRAYIRIVATPAGRVVLSAWVSTRNQRPDLLNPVVALEHYGQRYGSIPNDTIQDMGSGLNHHRKGFKPLFEDIEVGEVRHVIVAHKDRRARGVLCPTRNRTGGHEPRNAVSSTRNGERFAVDCPCL